MEPERPPGVSDFVRVVGIAVVVLFLVEPVAHGRDGGAPAGKPATEPGQPPVNLIALVGRKIEARYVEPKSGPPRFDGEYFLRYEVLQVVCGSYQKKEISFSSYVHIGRPPFLDHEYGLVYVSKEGERWVQQKYLFQPVYPTADGRWAGCGDPYDGGYIHGSGVKAEPIKFKPPVLFDIRNVPEFVRERKFPLPLFRYENETAVCLMGNYPDALFRVMKEGFLTARGVFRSQPR
jgi:hypothetical protein